MWPYIVFVACCSGEPLYDPQRDHPWNEVHRIFYARRFSNGEVYQHDAAFDPPWTTWSRFCNDQDFHTRVIDVLDAFLKQTDEAVERQPAVRRAILLRDLWPVFDAQISLPSDKTVRDRQKAIRERVAKVMRRLELSDEEAQQLPDNLRLECDRQSFPATFDPNSPELPFLPPDLFDKEGTWVPFAARRKAIAADQHLQQAAFWSIFVPFVRVSADRKATLEALRQYSDPRNSVPFPKGTTMALVRRTALPSTSGELIATPLVESLQLIVVDQPQDHRFKFVMDRAALLAGGRGLRAVAKNETLDAWGFGNLTPHEPRKDTDGDFLVLGQFAGPASRGLQSPADLRSMSRGKRATLRKFRPSVIASGGTAA
jgi:hypothetical protein